MGKGPTWDELQKAGLNEKPGETPLQKVIRKARKDERARTLGEIDPETYDDWEEREKSDSAGVAIAFDVTEHHVRLGEKQQRYRDELSEQAQQQTEDRKPVWAIWQAEAQNIRTRNPHLSKRDVAAKVKEALNLMDSVETIRKRI